MTHGIGILCGFTVEIVEGNKDVGWRYYTH